MAIRVAVDAMGGDDAPSVVIEGAVRAAQQSTNGLEILLFGPKALLRDAVAAHAEAALLPIQVVDAPEVIGMAEAPVAAVKTKRRSSIHLGLGALKQGHADAFISAGNTGAVMAASLLILGRLPGVARPSVPGYFPSIKEVCLVLDVGSNMDSKPEHLVQYAQMGTVYAQYLLNAEEPTVALLNIGEEPGKGNELAKAAYGLLQEAFGQDFLGNVEGRDIMTHAADVVVCDGFVGNALLKFGESMPTAVMAMVGQEIQRLGLSLEEQQVVAQVLEGVRKRFDSEEWGGAPLLGINGAVFIGHGRSQARGIERLIERAARAVELDLTNAIAAVLQG